MSPPTVSQRGRLGSGLDVEARGPLWRLDETQRGIEPDSDVNSSASLVSHLQAWYRGGGRERRWAGAALGGSGVGRECRRAGVPLDESGGGRRRAGAASGESDVRREQRRARVPLDESGVGRERH